MADLTVIQPDDLQGQGAVHDISTRSFVEQSYLSYLVPFHTNTELEEIFQADQHGRAIIDSIKQRESLFFDEHVDILLILKAPFLEEKVFQQQLSRLVISLEAGIVNEAVPGHNTPPGSDTIFHETLQDVADPFIIVDEEEGDSDEEPTQFIYAVWKMTIFLGRPRMRLHNSSVVFSASAGLKSDLPELKPASKGYLPSGVPSSLNLLDSFGNDPSLRGVKPRLSALRVARVAPVTSQQDLAQHIRALPQLKLRIHPVIHTRIRFTRPNTHPISSSVVAVLEIDFTSHFDVEVLLDKISLAVPDSTISCLSDGGAAMQLPLSCVVHDHITFLYHITPNSQVSNPQNQSRDLNISISALVQLEPGRCTPQLDMTWTASVDFTTPVNPGFAPNPGTGSIQRAHRPSQLSISGGQAVTPLKSPSLTRPDALPALEAAVTTRTDATLPDLGITMSFAAPSHPVRLGETFSWNVYIVNRSSGDKAAQPPRKLALVTVPKRRRGNEAARTMRPLSSSSRRRVGDKEIADAVLDDNVLNAMQKNSVVGSTDIICLSADTRVGPLAPGSCHVVDLQFLALKEGIVSVEAIRVVDLGSQEHVDIRDLPTIFVEPAAA